jgi:phenylacetate-CoA ligase
VTRDWLKERGISVRQCYATADIGAIAYETEAEEGLVVEEELLVEIVRPAPAIRSSRARWARWWSPPSTRITRLIRFATGDLSAILPGRSPCGRSNIRLKGWLGRADQTTKIKGMFVHPEQVAESLVAIRKSTACGWWSITPVARIAWCCIAKSRRGKRRGLDKAVIASLREVTKLRGEVAFCGTRGLAQ